MFNNTTNIEFTQIRHLDLACQIVVTVSYSLGIIGNIGAVYYLRPNKYKCNKIVLMLRCMALNDLVALIGMLVLMNLQLYSPYSKSFWFCVLRVVWRVFGIGSGCVAIIMAIERWLALTKPFLYKKYITYKVIKRSIFYLWMTGASLTCLPFLGFGLYYSTECVRYRDAKEMKDVVYAYIFFAFGTLLCICIVWCNLGVMKELARIGNRKHSLTRQLHRSFSRKSSEKHITHCNPSAEELAFAKLMAVLSITFVICWMPQMISIPLAQHGTKTKFSKIFFRVADILMALHFTLDPYVYVLLRFKKKRSSSHSEATIPLKIENIDLNITQDTIPTIH